MQSTEWMCGPGEVEVSGMNWEIGTDIYTPLYIKQITNENLLCSTADSAQLSSVVT